MGETDTVDSTRSTRVRVLAPWHEETGPQLALGMLTARARHWRDGALLERFDIGRPDTASRVEARIRCSTGPVVLLCSNYLWTVEPNLALAGMAAEHAPGTVVIHGGPSTPEYPNDAEEFLRTHGAAATILVHGEGEDTLVELLDAIGPDFPELDHERLAAVPGISFLGPGGAYVRTEDRARRATLDELPSPFLTGEFDHLPPSAWPVGLHLETNRGCPYGCTYCDWGSLTMSRVRMFDLDRVKAEIDWATERGFHHLSFTDANFGIRRRDVDIARHIVERKVATGYPAGLGFSPAKNTVRHLVDIIDVLRSVDLEVHADIGIQSTDPSTLGTIERSNISTGRFVELATELRRRDDFLACDFMIGLPGQTVDSFRGDLQFALDHEVLARVYVSRVLPNAPMNEPTYRARHRIHTDEQGFITSTATFGPEDRARMLRLVRVYLLAEHLGFLRHLLRFVQWDHDIPATEVMAAIADITAATPDRFPGLTALVEEFLDEPHVPDTWAPLYEEVERLLSEEFGLDTTAGSFAVMLAAQAFLAPHRGRTFPEQLSLDHDVVAYLGSATRNLLQSGGSARPSRPLSDYGPGTLEVTADPLGLCSGPVSFGGMPRVAVGETTFHLHFVCFELLSPLRSPFAGRRFRVARPDLAELVEQSAARFPTVTPSTTPSTSGTIQVSAVSIMGSAR